MKKLILTLVTLFPISVFALEIKVGDVLLQPRDCWSCTLIEEQENTIYSHMGLVIETTPAIKIVESLGSVRVISFEAFNKGTEKNQKISVRRFVNENISAYLESNQKDFTQFFKENFEGLAYDQAFLWNNRDKDGNELMYCSEMISKYIQGFLGINMPVKRMKFDVNPEKWAEYFRGEPPEGKWGNAPADFEKSDLFYEVGEI